MQLNITESPEELGEITGKLAGELIKKSIKDNGSANIILATGTSQFNTLNRLLKEKNIPWNKVKVFHLDEYIGISATHPASFRKYLKERFADQLTDLKDFYFINGETDPEAECERLGELIKKNPIDVALVGIGENGHLAFNDPPADFETEEPYIVVDLDEPCREQQVAEGWFPTKNEVPEKAISMSVQQILKSRKILCSVPGIRKAQAVKDCLEKEVSNLYPASILKQHPDCRIYLDKDSASLLSEDKIPEIVSKSRQI